MSARSTVSRSLIPVAVVYFYWVPFQRATPIGPCLSSALRNLNSWALCTLSSQYLATLGPEVSAQSSGCKITSLPPGGFKKPLCRHFFASRYAERNGLPPFVSCNPLPRWPSGIYINAMLTGMDSVVRPIYHTSLRALLLTLYWPGWIAPFAPRTIYNAGLRALLLTLCWPGWIAPFAPRTIYRYCENGVSKESGRGGGKRAICYNTDWDIPRRRSAIAWASPLRAMMCSAIAVGALPTTTILLVSHFQQPDKITEPFLLRPPSGSKMKCNAQKNAAQIQVYPPSQSSAFSDPIDVFHHTVQLPPHPYSRNFQRDSSSRGRESDSNLLDAKHHNSQSHPAPLTSSRSLSHSIPTLRYSLNSEVLRTIQPSTPAAHCVTGNRLTSYFQQNEGGQSNKVEKTGTCPRNQGSEGKRFSGVDHAFGADLADGLAKTACPA
ncbi:hypothetical protein DFH09DRAFT_1073361 [Mycena vulgaris]|nr:hypothetical protein DFH09DRAFT_1073361 [Mycena vulgaris]